MALVRRKLSGKKQTVLIAAVAGLIIVTVAVAYFALWSKPKVDLRPKSEILFGQKNNLAAPVPSRSGLEALKDLNQSAPASGLKKFGAWPLPVEPKGRDDLFGLPAAE